MWKLAKGNDEQNEDARDEESIYKMVAAIWSPRTTFWLDSSGLNKLARTKRCKGLEPKGASNRYQKVQRHNDIPGIIKSPPIGGWVGTVNPPDHFPSEQKYSRKAAD